MEIEEFNKHANFINTYLNENKVNLEERIHAFLTMTACILVEESTPEKLVKNLERAAKVLGEYGRAYYEHKYKS